MRQISLVILVGLCLAYAFTAPTLSQTYHTDAFNQLGAILGVDKVWADAGIFTNKISTPKQDGYYLQASNMLYVHNNIGVVQMSLDGDNLQIQHPEDFIVKMSLIWNTYRSGSFSDTNVESGNGEIEVRVTDYSYTLKFAKSKDKFAAPISDFKCSFYAELDPKLTGAKNEYTLKLLSSLKEPIQNALTSSYCPKLSTKLKSTMDSFLASVQTDQTIKLSYNGESDEIKITLLPTNDAAFSNTLFTINSTQSLQNSQETITNFLKESSVDSNVKLLSDSEAEEQAYEICFKIDKEMLDGIVNKTIDFYNQDEILVNGDSNYQKYFPYNSWQYWEAALYDDSLYQKIGKEKGKYQQLDPIELVCEHNYEQTSTLTSSGGLNVTMGYSCGLELTDSNNDNDIVQLYKFKFTAVFSANFYTDGNYINCKVDTVKIDRVEGLSLNSDKILSTLISRFGQALELEVTKNVKMFGPNGIKLDVINGKAMESSLASGGVNLCFR